LKSNISIVTDSTAYLSEEEVMKFEITVIPLTINFEDHSLTDGLIDSKELFRKIDASPKLPSTSQPSVGHFKESYEKILQEGKEIISLHISEKLSGTVQSARIAAEMLDEENISVVDTEHFSEPLAVLVKMASKWVRQGLDRKEIVNLLEKEKKRIKVFFIPDTLEYLKKGGRIGGAKALLGTLLQIKPVLMIKDGYVQTLDKVRTRKKAINRMLQELPFSEKIKVAVVHSLAEKEAQLLKKRIIKDYPNVVYVNIKVLGPVLCIHGGPKLIGIAFWPYQ